MLNKNYNTENISEALRTKVLSWDITPNVPLSRPQNVKESWNDFILIEVATKIIDRSAYGSTTVVIDLFVRSNNGIKNTKRFKEMESAILNNLSGGLKIDDYYFEYLTTVNNGFDGTSFHSKGIVLTTFINLKE